MAHPHPCEEGDTNKIVNAVEAMNDRCCDFEDWLLMAGLLCALIPDFQIARAISPKLLFVLVGKNVIAARLAKKTSLPPTPLEGGKANFEWGRAPRVRAYDRDLRRANGIMASGT